MPPRLMITLSRVMVDAIRKPPGEANISTILRLDEVTVLKKLAARGLSIYVRGPKSEFGNDSYEQQLDLFFQANGLAYFVEFDSFGQALKVRVSLLCIGP